MPDLLGRPQPSHVQIKIRGHALRWRETKSDYKTVDDANLETATHRAIPVGTVLQIVQFLLTLGGSPVQEGSRHLLNALCSEIKIEAPKIIVPN
jgi:hypothetical protein